MESAQFFLGEPSEPVVLIAQHYLAGLARAQVVDPHELESLLHVVPYLERRNRLDLQPGFLGDLAAQSRYRRLAELDPSTGKVDPDSGVGI